MTPDFQLVLVNIITICTVNWTKIYMYPINHDLFTDIWCFSDADIWTLAIKGTVRCLKLKVGVPGTIGMGPIATQKVM